MRLLIMAMAGGVVLGWLYGMHVAFLIAESLRRKDPNHPLDHNIIHLVAGFGLLGLIGGAMIGAVVAVIVRLRIKKKRASAALGVQTSDQYDRADLVKQGAAFGAALGVGLGLLLDVVSRTEGFDFRGVVLLLSGGAGLGSLMGRIAGEAT
jgi:MFS family permease